MTATMEKPVEAAKGRWITRDVVTTKMFVTPETAVEMLERNSGNRPIRETHVADLEGVFRRGEMAINGATIGFDTAGRLVNGQHRLTACVRSGVGFWVIVVTGLPPASFDTIDSTSRPRSVGDVLATQNVIDSTRVAAAVRGLWRFAVTGQVYCGAAGRGACSGYTAKLAQTIIELNPGFLEVVARARLVSLWQTATMAVLMSVFTRANAAVAEEFFEVMYAGKHPDSPFHVFREWMIREKSLRGHRLINDRVAAAKAIKAWNARMEGRPPHRLLWVIGDEFPRIAGLDYTNLKSWIGE